MYISAVATLMFTERVNPQYIIVNMCYTKIVQIGQETWKIWVN
jgi:hypothetical protein